MLSLLSPTQWVVSIDEMALKLGDHLWVAWWLILEFWIWLWWPSWLYWVVDAAIGRFIIRFSWLGLAIVDGGCRWV